MPKNFDHALVEFAQTLPTPRRLWEVKASLSDFQKTPPGAEEYERKL